MSIKSALRILCVPLTLTVFLIFGPAQLRSSNSGTDFPLYHSVRNLQVQEKGVRVSGISIKKDAAQIQLTNGDLWFFNPIDGKILGAVFIGTGNIKLAPCLKNEEKFLSKLTNGEPFVESFTKLTLFFADDTFQHIKDKSLAPSAAKADKAQKFFKETNQLFRKGRKYPTPNNIGYFLPWNINARLLFEILNPRPSETFFLACGNGEKYGDFFYIEDPLGVPGHEPEQVVLLNLSQKNLGSWYSAHFSNYYQDGRSLVCHPLRLIEVDHYSIEARLDGSDMKAQTTMHFTPLEDNLSILPLYFDPGLRIEKVTDQNGNNLDFIQEKYKEDGDLSVIFPSPLKKAKPSTLIFLYAGDNSIIDQENGNYSLVDRSNWYPNPGLGAYSAKFDMVFDIPAETRILSTGQLVGGHLKGDRFISTWKSKIPLKVAGFNYGAFITKSSHEKSTGYRIETCTNVAWPNWLLQHSFRVTDPDEAVVLRSLDMKKMMEKVHAEAELAINMYSKCYGELPYKRISITQQPYYDFGQAWPTLIYMPITAFLPSLQKEVLGLNYWFHTRSFYRLLCAHEVAHQWWGHWVGCSNYRDQWLSEGLAVFSSSLFAQTVYGLDYMNEYWEELKEQLTSRNPRRIKPIEMGSLDMGYRLDTGKTGPASQAVIYAKGGYILHMLRMIMWDPKEGDSRFLAMLQDMLKAYANGFITTADFQAHVEKHMTPKMNLRSDNKMDWFFNQWVYDTQIPQYELGYKITETKEGKPLVVLKVKQSHVRDDFVMLVPVYGQFRKNILRICQVRLEGNSETQAISIPLGGKPDKLLLCAQHDILCEVK